MDVQGYGFPGIYTTNDVPSCPSDGLLSGTEGPDKLNGLKGEDETRGLGAADVVFGGADNDDIYGGRAAYRRAAPAATDSRPCLGDSGPTIVTLRRDGSRGLVHTGRTVLGVVGQRHRRGPARPPLPHLVSERDSECCTRSFSVAGISWMCSE